MLNKKTPDLPMGFDRRRVCVDCRALLADDNPERLTPESGDAVRLVRGRRDELAGVQAFTGYLCDHHIRCSDWLQKEEFDHA